MTGAADPTPVPPHEWYQLADELRGLATLAARYADDPYERDRADHLRDLAARLFAGVHGAPLDVVRPVFTDDAWARVTPVIGAEAVAVDGAGRVLLCRRRDSGRWCLPGGVCETGQSPSEAALRELWEEAGLRGTVTGLLGVFDDRAWGGASTAHVVAIAYRVETIGTDASPGSEMLETGWFAVDGLPADLHPGHERRVPHLLDLLATGATHHDPATTVTGALPPYQRG